MQKFLSYNSLSNSYLTETLFDSSGGQFSDVQAEKPPSRDSFMLKIESGQQLIPAHSQNNSFISPQSITSTQGGNPIILLSFSPQSILAAQGGNIPPEDTQYRIDKPICEEEDKSKKRKPKIDWNSKIISKEKKQFLFEEFKKHTKLCGIKAKFEAIHKPCKKEIAKDVNGKMHCLTKYCKCPSCIEIKYAKAMFRLKRYLLTDEEMEQEEIARKEKKPIDIVSQKFPFCYHGETSFKRGIESLKGLPIREQKKKISRVLHEFEKRLKKELGIEFHITIFDIEVINMFKKGKKYPLLHFHFLILHDEKKQIYLPLKAIKKIAIDMSRESKKGYSFFFKINTNKEPQKGVRFHGRYLKRTIGVLSYFAKRICGILGHDETPYDPLDHKKISDIVNAKGIYFYPDFMTHWEYFTEIYNTRALIIELPLLSLHSRLLLTSEILKQMPEICPHCSKIITIADILLIPQEKDPPKPPGVVVEPLHITQEKVFSSVLEMIASEQKISFERIFPVYQSKTLPTSTKEKERQDLFELAQKIGCTLEQLKRLGLT